MPKKPSHVESRREGCVRQCGDRAEGRTQPRRSRQPLRRFRPGTRRFDDRRQRLGASPSGVPAVAPRVSASLRAGLAGTRPERNATVLGLDRRQLGGLVDLERRLHGWRRHGSRRRGRNWCVRARQRQLGDHGGGRSGVPAARVQWPGVSATPTPTQVDNCLDETRRKWG